MKHINRREFIKLSLAAGSLIAIGQSDGFLLRGTGKRETEKRVIVLGLDGLDPGILEELMKSGKLPNFMRLSQEGSFCRLATSIPPQSPVAWSNFITGTDPGGHAIFDFLHRNPENYIPFLSTSKTEEGHRALKIGKYVLPLSGGRVELLRQGKAFWQILEEYDIPTTVFKMPSNFPPAKSKQRTLSGMGTPDILGSYGIFNYYTTSPTELKEDIGGGRIHEVKVVNNTVEARLPGPRNTFIKERPESFLDFRIYLDPTNPVGKISIQNHEFILREGEWSGWKRIKFRVMPTKSVSGICIFYLKQVRPDFKLYVSPVNIDPRHPALPISTPASYSKELEKKFGPFFTKGLPADTKALDHGVLDDGEFLKEDDFVLQEREKMLDYELERFESGLLFYYFSSTDQRQHMFWRLIDREHPAYDEKLASKYGKTIENIYIEMDRMIEKAMEKVDKKTILIVISDHGFTSFRRCFNLNTWLKENGYLTLIKPWQQGKTEFFMNTNWKKTKAYALGLNSLYINQKGREREGIVNSGPEKEALVREIAQKLEKVIDPLTGKKVVLKAYVARDVYHGPYVDEAPEIILGYNHGYRCSWATPLGRIPRKIFEDNLMKWSGDHCMDPKIIPGSFLSNVKIKSSSPALYDVTATILSIFGIRTPVEMRGRPLF